MIECPGNLPFAIVELYLMHDRIFFLMLHIIYYAHESILVILLQVNSAWSNTYVGVYHLRAYLLTRLLPVPVGTRGREQSTPSIPICRHYRL